ncbi:MAG: ABC transporter substrate-binding protein [Candidatus Dactylopiibacterium carminicum]|uniref:ABC transporter substrate-binding protein n=1 Tax=Candidatus Dactylopiibacterium carminicum TaxID=857335 RepID=A0A272ENJ6_9RHOO|nr:ABC transporter substrate-binding protein [Candidatus Dactylopiibacterium carminicum]KAF7600769.1 ABC transporter substrate-binding protein [Candidatus Dactylopiibacterium carminicum]PAS91671.1 MAG: ABC transporter substrate-binding protein [Candidatus Dactylopiibacterium carminicum]PAS96563.1 MAG: ABC transporter substrate-binding protein [Candidatus Dactylopiibacterium carminicum]PAT00774.1 MAG: ABC transporter substrate-binding protein [Candidatus Dactylopiibacterium carminicum]
MPSRRQFLCLSMLGSLALAPGLRAATRTQLPALRLSGPAATVSAPLVHMVESGALADVAAQVSFQPWRDPDQLRLLAIEGKADFLAAPSNVAATLYNRGAKLQLVNISTWGLLWLVSRSADKKRLADFRDEEIAVPFRGDMPDIVLSQLAAMEGIALKKRYVASPVEAMQLLIARRVDHALLQEPAASMALRKTKSFPLGLVAPELHRAVDLQTEWGRAFKRQDRIPQAGLIACGAMVGNAALQARVHAAYTRSLAACLADPAAAGRLLAKHIDMITPEAAADALSTSRMESVAARQARQSLEFFYAQLMRHDAGLVGNKLPDDAFYGV